MTSTPVNGVCTLLPVTVAELPVSSCPSVKSSVPVPIGLVELEICKARLRIEGEADTAVLSLILEHLLK